MLAIAGGYVIPQAADVGRAQPGAPPKVVQEVLSAIERIRDEGVTVLLVEQSAQQALTIADGGHVIETGRMVLEGSGEELLQNDHVGTAYLGL